MRLLLFIPALVLFLTHVPFMQSMSLEKAALMTESGNCEKQKQCSGSDEGLQASCSREQSDCQATSDKTDIQFPAGNNCCQKTETTCVCIYCFQFAAPFPANTEFQFNCLMPLSKVPLFVLGHVPDQYIVAPWQPPDMI